MNGKNSGLLNLKILLKNDNRGRWCAKVAVFEFVRGVFGI